MLKKNRRKVAFYKDKPFQNLTKKFSLKISQK